MLCPLLVYNEANQPYVCMCSCLWLLPAAMLLPPPTVQVVRAQALSSLGYRAAPTVSFRRYHGSTSTLVSQFIHLPSPAPCPRLFSASLFPALQRGSSVLFF